MYTCDNIFSIILCIVKYYGWMLPPSNKIIIEAKTAETAVLLHFHFSHKHKYIYTPT